jgi:segregation and condensation protein B
VLSKVEVKAAIEALLFMATDPLPIKVIKEVLDIGVKDIKDALELLEAEYTRGDKGIELVQVSNGYQLQTKAEFLPFIKELHKPEMNNTLSQAALETLAIIAYKQPATRAEVEDIRGVNVEKALKTLQKRGLIEEQGRKDTIGNPILYGTTAEFLQYMGLNSLDELPPAQEFTELYDEEIEKAIDNIEDN